MSQVYTAHIVASVGSWAKHPVKVHVGAGISLRGLCGICVFEGKIIDSRVEGLCAVIDVEN